jgi:hypothetical protein
VPLASDDFVASARPSVALVHRPPQASLAAFGPQRGLTKHGEIVGWLKSDYKLGHGHATAIAGVVLKAGSPPRSDAKKMDDLFSGTKASWRKPCDALVAKLAKGGPDVEAALTSPDN